ALNDREVETVARAMGVDVFHGEPEITRQRLIDASVANHGAWPADAKQGEEDGTLPYRADTNPGWVASWTDDDWQRAREAGRRLLERADRDESGVYVRDRGHGGPNRTPRHRRARAGRTRDAVLAAARPSPTPTGAYRNPALVTAT